MQLFNRGKCTYTLLDSAGKAQKLKPNQIITIDDGSAEKFMRIYSNDLTVLSHEVPKQVSEDAHKNGRGRPKKNKEVETEIRLDPVQDS